MNSSDRGKKIVDGEMFSLEERGEGRAQDVPGHPRGEYKAKMQTGLKRCN